MNLLVWRKQKRRSNNKACHGSPMFPSRTGSCMNSLLVSVCWVWVYYNTVSILRLQESCCLLLVLEMLLLLWAQRRDAPHTVLFDNNIRPISMWSSGGWGREGPEKGGRRDLQEWCDFWGKQPQQLGGGARRGDGFTMSLTLSERHQGRAYTHTHIQYFGNIRFHSLEADSDLTYTCLTGA